jgi:hypothetical protein
MREMHTPAVYKARREHSQAVAREILRALGGSEAGVSLDADDRSVSLPEVVAHIRDWSRACDAVSACLVLYRNEIAQYGLSPVVRMAESFIDHFLGLMARYQRDLDRLTAELPKGVQQRHVEMATRLFESSAEEESVCADFARNLDFHSLESRKAFVAAIQGVYSCARSAVIDMRDLGNIVPQLRTLVAHGSPS